MQVDTHVHFWKYEKAKDAWITDDMKVLQQDYIPQTILPTLKRNDIDVCVAVQVDQTELEILFLTELAKKHDIIKGVAGWIDLQNENIESRLQYFSQFPIIKGWRHIAQSESDGFLLKEKFQQGIGVLQSYGYTYDILIFQHQLKPALEFVSHFPEQKFVIDHCAKPDIENKKN